MPRIAVAKVIPFLKLTNFFVEKNLTFFKMQLKHAVNGADGGVPSANCHDLTKYFCDEI